MYFFYGELLLTQALQTAARQAQKSVVRVVLQLQQKKTCTVMI
jgi:hypothetical protein